MTQMTRNKQAAWEELTNQFGPRTRTMEEVVAKLQGYVATYHKQSGYENYPDSMLIDDVLYGLGQALDDNYQYADGFERFKNFLREYLGEKKDV